MAKILNPWKQYRPWFIIGENGGQVEFEGFHLEWESCGYPPGDPPHPPYPLDGEAWLAVFHRVNK